jgi:hypothetical protein
MGQHYLVKCDCGQPLTVEGRQAGQVLTCSCGRPVRVPTLRHLRTLPQAAPETAGFAPRWTQGQGVTFVVGLLVIAIGLGVVCYFLPQRLGLSDAETPYDRFLAREDLGTLSAEDAYSAWQAYRAYGLRWGHTPEYLRARRRAMTLNAYLAVAGGAILVGGSLVGAAFFFLRPPESATRRTG